MYEVRLTSKDKRSKAFLVFALIVGGIAHDRGYEKWFGTILGMVWRLCRIQRIKWRLSFECSSNRSLGTTPSVAKAIMKGPPGRMRLRSTYLTLEALPHLITPFLVLLVEEAAAGEDEKEDYGDVEGIEDTLASSPWGVGSRFYDMVQVESSQTNPMCSPLE
ncbi:unnamed protein product [Linum trigynum]|uniref:Uncharacterized protein n=1 Tax=Linum trigynum TaxID=586398 RepID=A0AAV2CVZ9_9ROSI